MGKQLLGLLGIQHPIIQAPMAGISTPRLAAAVSESGALGSIAIGAMNVAQARQSITELRSRTARPFNVNLFAHLPAATDPAREAAWIEWMAPLFEARGAAAPVALREIYASFLVDADMLAMLVAERPAVVSFHFGVPSSTQVAALHDAGIVLMASVTSLKEALLVERAGIDVVIAQGIEAGGHRGVFDTALPDDRLDTLALVRQLVRKVQIPVVAAGGIMDGAGIAEALAAGAQAAQLGTAFIACPESSASAHHRVLLARPGVRTELTDTISGRPARGIVNRMFEELGAPGHPPVPDYPVAYHAVKALLSAGEDEDYSVNWAGTGASLARPMAAVELVRALAAEMAAQLNLMGP